MYTWVHTTLCTCIYICVHTCAYVHVVVVASFPRHDGCILTLKLCMMHIYWSQHTSMISYRSTMYYKPLRVQHQAGLFQESLSLSEVSVE